MRQITGLNQWLTNVLIVVTVLLVAGTSVAVSVPKPDPLPETTDLHANEEIRFVVGFHEEPPQPLFERLLEAGATSVAPLNTVNAAVVWGPQALMPIVADWHEVRYVEPDGRVEFFNYQTADQTGEQTVRRGDPPLAQSFSGEGVTVAVMDSGIDTNHPDVSHAVVDRFHFDAQWAHEGILDEDTRDRIAATSPGTAPVTTHGLSVGGILAGTGEAALEVDMRGVAVNTSLVDYNVCCTNLVTQVAWVVDDEAGCCPLNAWGSDFLMAYDHLLRHYDDPDYPGSVKVVTNQWGFLPDEPYPRETFETILQETIDRGMTVIFSAGNSGPDEDTVGEPQNLLDDIIVVGVSCPAIDGFDHWAPGDGKCGLGDLAVYSSRGPSVDVVAPAAGIWTPKTLVHTLGNQEFTEPRPGFDEDPYATANNRLWYGVFGGTSAAAPYVAGTVALMLEAEPDLSPQEIEQILKETAQDFGNPVPDSGWGTGEVRVADAVLSALEGAPGG